MAIKSEAPGDAGFALWDEWSRRGATYRERDALDAWRSIKASGKVGIGSLFHIAKGYGFKWPSPGDGAGADAAGHAVAQAQAARLAQERRQQQEAEAAELLRQHEEAARRCQAWWDGAAATPPKGGAGYLQRKGVAAHGLRFLPGGIALVPMCDLDGRLWSVQRLLPKRLRDKASGQDTTDKLYGPAKREGEDKPPHSRKTGLCHLIGQAGPLGNAELLLLAEGYATAATLHQATGRPVAVCFDSGNLVHVAQALRQRWPALPLLVCGDDDRAAEAKGRKNAGRAKAAEAAELAGAAADLAAAVLPAGLPDDVAAGSDFNDLAGHAGLQVVADQVQAAAAALLASAGRAAAPAGADGAAGQQLRPGDDGHLAPVLRLVPGGKGDGGQAGAAGADACTDGAAGAKTTAGGGGRGGRGGHGGGGGDGGGGHDGGPDQASRDPFHVDDSGVWHVARDADGNEKRPTWVCAPLHVTARTRGDDANGWGCLLQFADPDGNAKSWAMPSAMLSGEGGEWAGRLRDMGLQIAPGTRARNLLAQYIDTRRPVDRVTCTDRVGWHGPVYVLPSGSIAAAEAAAEDRRYVFQSDSGMEDTFRRHGTLDEWRQAVAALAVGNSRLVFALCCAFAGPALRLAGMESGGFHFRGDSSLGKTTALKVAASVWGRPTYMQRWRTTDNALEATAVQHCDSLLILDEFGQLDPRVAGECAYMLANDQEKGRATRGGLARKRRTWRLLFLSSGEVSLADHMAEAGKRARAGMEVRMLDVPLDAGLGMGGIEALHDHDGPGALADAIVGAGARFYGTAGRAWLQWCCDQFGSLQAELAGLVEQYRNALVPEAGAEQVRRAGSRFALVAAAGELATRAGITGWAEGEALQSVRQCFNAWLGARGHMHNSEEAQMLHQVRSFLELNGEGRFAWWHRAMDDHTPKTLNRAGFRRLLGDDGKPIKSDSDHQREYGERISPSDAERVHVDYVVLREVFEREVCRGFDSTGVARLLKRRGHLVGEGDRLQDRQRLPGMGGEKAACYRIKPSIFSDEL